MTKAIIDDARRVAKALGWHPTAQPCQCWNCQANRALIAAADEIERLRAIENAALHVASSFLKRNNTVDPLTMHKLDFALEASAVEPKADQARELGWSQCSMGFTHPATEGYAGLNGPAPKSEEQAK